VSTASRLAAVKAALRVNFSSLKTIKNALASPKPWAAATYDLDLSVGDTAALTGTTISITVNPNRELGKLIAAQHFQLKLTETLGGWLKGLSTHTKALIDIAQNLSVKAQVAVPVSLVHFVSDLIAKDKFRWRKEERYKFDVVSRFLANFGSGLTTALSFDNLRQAREKAVSSLYDDFLRIAIKSGIQSKFTSDELQTVRALISDPTSFYLIGAEHGRDPKLTDAFVFCTGAMREWLNCANDEPREFVEEVLPMLALFVPLFDAGVAWFKNGGFRAYIGALQAKVQGGEEIYRSTCEEVLQQHLPEGFQETPIAEPFVDVVSSLTKEFFKDLLNTGNNEWKEPAEAMGLDVNGVSNVINAFLEALIQLFERVLPAAYTLVCSFRFLSNVSAVSEVAQADLIRVVNHGAAEVLDDIPDFPALANKFFDITKSCVLDPQPHNTTARANQEIIRKIYKELDNKESSIRKILDKHISRW